MLDWLFGKRKEQEEPQPPKKKKPAAQQEAEDKWKYDFLIQFLSGPLWKTSLLDFIDYNCIVFDNQQQNKFQYTIVHNKFKELVASLFDSMVKQVGLDDEQLAELLEKGFSSSHKKIFNQLLLADDFLRFKQLMVNRNKALEAEAIKALNLNDKVEDKKDKKDKKDKNQIKPDKKAGLRQEDVIRQSQRAEEQRKRKIQQEEQQQLRKVLEMSRIQAEEVQMINKLEKQASEKEVHKEEIKPIAPVIQKQEHIQKPIPTIVDPVPIAQKQNQLEQKPKSKQSTLDPLPAIKRNRKKEKVESPKVQQPPIQQKQPEPVIPVYNPPAIQQVQEKQQKTEAQSQEDRKKRLIEQRQKIRKKKQQERKKQMADQQIKPAHAQTIVLQDDGIHDTQIAGEEQKKEKVNNDEIERRRELMKKIKNRIVDDF